jgi:EpsI family protein
MSPTTKHLQLKPRIWLAAIGFGLCYSGVIRQLVGTWSNHPLYSYGFAVPMISGYVLFVKWDELRALRPVPDALFGPLAAVLGLSALIVGRLGSIQSLQQFSLVLTLTGLVLVLFGRQTLRIAAFPLLYLMSAIPIWDRVIQGLQAPSQVLSGTIALEILHAVGVPAFREGTTLVLPNVTLDILRACSGVNQLIAVFAIAAPAAYLWLSGVGKRAALIVFAISVAYVSNGFRIALVGFLDYKHLAGNDIRGLHLLEGLATSLVGYSLIFAGVSVLARMTPARGGVRRSNPVDSSVVSVGTSAPRLLRIETGVLVLTLLVGVFITRYRPVEVGLGHRLRAIPSRLGPWSQDGSNAPGSGFRLAVADDELDRTYQLSSGQRLRLYIGYQEFEDEGRELSTASSWALSNTASPVEMTLNSKIHHLNEVAQNTGTMRSGKLFWFDVCGRTVTSWYSAKAYTVWNALARGRTNGGIVLLEWDVPTQADFETSRREALDFVRLLGPYVPEFLPS